MKSMALALASLLAGVADAQPASTVLSWSEAAVFPVAATPGRVTDIVLEPGEQLVGGAAVAAGDTARWIIGQTESGAGEGRRAHVLVKPTLAGIATNLLIATDRRTYHLELRSTPAAYQAMVSWRYPAGELIALRGAPAPAPRAPADPDPALIERIGFGWRIEGEAPWRPMRVFDDGRRVVIEFPAGATEIPPLFERSAAGAPQMLNYRVLGRRMVVDRLFADGELRLGDGKAQVRVRLVRAPQ
jgi:type IV secretion system protein VirB9